MPTQNELDQVIAQAAALRTQREASKDPAEQQRLLDQIDELEQRRADLQEQMAIGENQATQRTAGEMDAVVDAQPHDAFSALGRQAGQAADEIEGGED